MICIIFLYLFGGAIFIGTDKGRPYGFWEAIFTMIAWLPGLIYFSFSKIRKEMR